MGVTTEHDESEIFYDPRVIAVVGACASGKSALVSALRRAGFRARQVLQEHSYVPTMWQRITAPDVLIFLDVGMDAVRRRRKVDYDDAYLQEQYRRLAHARQHADVIIQTDNLSLEEVVEQALDYLQKGYVGSREKR